MRNRNEGKKQRNIPLRFGHSIVSSVNGRVDPRKAGLSRRSHSALSHSRSFLVIVVFLCIFKESKNRKQGYGLSSPSSSSTSSALLLRMRCSMEPGFVTTHKDQCALRFTGIKMNLFEKMSIPFLAVQDSTAAGPSSRSVV